jgi:hypothetical protein
LSVDFIVLGKLISCSLLDRSPSMMTEFVPSSRTLDRNDDILR